MRIPNPDSQRRVEAILHDPDGYFAEARAQAWRQAAAEVDTELAARAEARGRHGDYQDDSGWDPS